jgi:hypothetical protein
MYIMTLECSCGLRALIKDLGSLTNYIVCVCVLLMISTIPWKYNLFHETCHLMDKIHNAGHHIRLCVSVCVVVVGIKLYLSSCVPVPGFPRDCLLFKGGSWPNRCETVYWKISFSLLHTLVLLKLDFCGCEE